MEVHDVLIQRRHSTFAALDRPNMAFPFDPNNNKPARRLLDDLHIHDLQKPSPSLLMASEMEDQPKGLLTFLDTEVKRQQQQMARMYSHSDSRRISAPACLLEKVSYYNFFYIIL